MERFYFSSGRVQGFYSRNLKARTLTYDALIEENENIFNGQGNTLMIPI